MATINANPVPAALGEDVFTATAPPTNGKWRFDPTNLPAGYTYKVHSQIGNGVITPSLLTPNVAVDLGPASSALTAFITYMQDGTTDEVRFTHAIPATTGASVIGWTPGEGMSRAPQPTLTITIAAGVGEA